jgi:plasmid maintenance system antidote protein VapI
VIRKSPNARRATRPQNDRIDANGTAWRMRSLVAMGHDAARIARALNVTPDTIRRLIRGDSKTVTVAFHQLACQLWEAWWDKTPPERTPAERRAATKARRQAEQHDWPAAAGLDEDLLDNRGYKPWCHYHPATGTGIAPDFHVGQATQPKVRRIA